MNYMMPPGNNTGESFGYSLDLDPSERLLEAFIGASLLKRLVGALAPHRSREKLYAKRQQSAIYLANGSRIGQCSAVMDSLIRASIAVDCGEGRWDELSWIRLQQQIHQKLKPVSEGGLGFVTVYGENARLEVHPCMPVIVGSAAVRPIIQHPLIVVRDERDIVRQASLSERTDCLGVNDPRIDVLDTRLFDPPIGLPRAEQSHYQIRQLRFFEAFALSNPDVIAAARGQTPSISS